MATETQVQIVREDPEIEAYRLGLLESAKKLADQPISLPRQQIAGMSGLQQEALRLAQSGIGSYLPYLQQAGATLDPSNVQAYMNPYQSAVQDEINRSFNIQASQAQQGAVGAGAFGGGRAAIQQSEIGRNRAAALAQSQAQAFTQAQQAQQQAFQNYGRMAELGQGLQQREVGMLFDFGKQQQAQQQAELEAQRQSQLAQLYEPYQRYGFLSDIYKGAPTTQQTIASTTAPSVSPAQQFLGLGIAGLSAFGGAQKAGLFG
jgi:hypothetical protein